MRLGRILHGDDPSDHLGVPALARDRCVVAAGDGSAPLRYHNERLGSLHQRVNFPIIPDASLKIGTGMDEAKLRSRLNELTDAESDLCRAIRADCKRSKSFADDDTCVRAAERQKVIEILREQPEFHAGRLVMWAESSLHALYDTGLPHALIRRARAEGPDAAMQFLRGVLAVEEAEFLRVVPIWGLSVDEPTWLADDICIAPMHRIPSSPPYDYFREKHRPSLP
jgi:hypothetical protein